MSEIKHLEAKLALLQGQLAKMNTERSAQDADAMKAIQTRADAVMALFGERVPEPPIGATVTEYHRGVLDRVKKHSPRFKNESLYGGGRAALEAVQERIYADAVENARHDAEAKPGILVSMQELDPAGRTITKFVGDPLAWMAPYMRGGQIGVINRTPGGKPR